MSVLEFGSRETRGRAGLKGPRGAEWLVEQGIALPLEPNTWIECRTPTANATPLLVARLGTSEFFLEDGATARRLAAAVQTGMPGIYPVPREDAAFLLSGDGALDVLAQVCSVNFAALDLAARPVIMTMAIGISVLIVPQTVSGEVQYRIWCDPTFGSYLDESFGAVVIECGGTHGGKTA